MQTNNYSHYKQVYAYMRFSTSAQAKGHSEDRQRKLIENFAQSNALDITYLDVDRGLSGFHNKNIEFGSLGLFIKDIEAGRIQKGSLLLLENLDRLSRQKIRPAMNLLGSILDAGVDVITLADNRLHRSDDMDNIAELMMSLMIMSRAHEESAIKSQRGKAVHRSKKEALASGKVVRIARLPFWLKQDPQTLEITENDRAKDVRLIFEMYLKRISAVVIREKLKELGIPSPNGKGIFGISQLHILLNEEKVTGMFEGGRVAPQTISDEDFKLVSVIKRKNKGATTSRRDSFPNIFSKVGFCGECKCTLFKVRTPTGPKLQCSSTRCGTECSMKHKQIDYDVVEDALGYWLGSHINITSEEESKDRAEYQRQLDNIAGTKHELESKLSNLSQAIADLGYSKEFKTKHMELSSALDSITKQEDDITFSVSALNNKNCVSSNIMSYNKQIKTNEGYRRDINTLLQNQGIKLLCRIKGDKRIIKIKHKGIKYKLNKENLFNTKGLGERDTRTVKRMHRRWSLI